MAFGRCLCGATLVLGSAGDCFALLALGRIFHEAVVGFVRLAGGALARRHCDFDFVVVCLVWMRVGVMSR
jgi:hypothetical protein